MPSPEKFLETLTDFSVGKDILEEMYTGFGQLVSKTPKKTKAAFFSQALEVMNARLPADEVRAILEANACCKGGSRLKNSREFARINAELGVEERLKLISGRPYLNMGRAELDADGFLIVHAVSFHNGERFECVCPTVSKIKRDRPIPREYCYCCGGHFKFHYEIMLNVKLEMCQILSSPHDTEGREPCAFKYRILEKAE